jgi:hypothetical protein
MSTFDSLSSAASVLLHDRAQQAASSDLAEQRIAQIHLLLRDAARQCDNSCGDIARRHGELDRALLRGASLDDELDVVQTRLLARTSTARTTTAQAQQLTADLRVVTDSLAGITPSLIQTLRACRERTVAVTSASRCTAALRSADRCAVVAFHADAVTRVQEMLSHRNSVCAQMFAETTERVDAIASDIRGATIAVAEAEQRASNASTRLSLLRAQQTDAGAAAHGAASVLHDTAELYAEAIAKNHAVAGELAHRSTVLAALQQDAAAEAECMAAALQRLSAEGEAATETRNAAQAALDELAGLLAAKHAALRHAETRFAAAATQSAASISAVCERMQEWRQLHAALPTFVQALVAVAEAEATRAAQQRTLAGLEWQLAQRRQFIERTEMLDSGASTTSGRAVQRGGRRRRRHGPSNRTVSCPACVRRLGVQAARGYHSARDGVLLDHDKPLPRCLHRPTCAATAPAAIPHPSAAGARPQTRAAPPPRAHGGPPPRTDDAAVHVKRRKRRLAVRRRRSLRSCDG